MNRVSNAQKTWALLARMTERAGHDGWPKTTEFLVNAANWWADESDRSVGVLRHLQRRYADRIVKVEYLGWE